MVICFAATVPILESGGVEVLVRELIRGLSGRFTVLLTSPDATEDITGGVLGHHLSGHLELKVAAPDCTDVLIPWLRDHQVDVCHFHSTGSFAWGAASWSRCVISKVSDAGIRCINTNHQALTPFDRNKVAYPLSRRLASFARKWPGKVRQLSNVEHEILVSRNDLRSSRRYFPLYRSRMSQIYHSRMDEATVAVPPTESGVILCLASVCFRKGQHVLAEAFSRIAAEHAGWKLRLVGRILEPACAEQIRQTADRAGVSDRILLPGPSDDPVGEITEAEIYVQPSLLEGLGLSLQEAMILGRPAIGSRTGGITELLTDGVSGTLVEPNDVVELAGALDAMIADPEGRCRMGAAASEEARVKGMTREAMCDAYGALYRIPQARG